ncbi:hypothetical protein FHS27_000461 [Rhodopirellula rubra]|uniref:Uncharacterized protein n=1 Tax=Aporhodopirellula rubra TaxID=980271 RepID=A0A7W5H2Y8_9BACT|nr:hypothetical protein [Aporhodopirellula rubra]MBB3204697.1 hypothetical protein [Aporhodopirellula rubra]
MSQLNVDRLQATALGPAMTAVALSSQMKKAIGVRKFRPLLFCQLLCQQ